MSRSVVTAVTDRWESVLVTTLERGTDAQIARRCPDLADLLAVAGSGLAQVAMVSADLRSLDRTALDHLRECSVIVVGIYPPGDEMAELHLRQLGISTVIPADASGEVIQEALDAWKESQAQGGPPRGPRGNPGRQVPADPTAPQSLPVALVPEPARLIRPAPRALTPQALSAQAITAKAKSPMVMTTRVRSGWASSSRCGARQVPRDEPPWR